MEGIGEDGGHTQVSQFSAEILIAKQPTYQLAYHRLLRRVHELQALVSSFGTAVITLDLVVCPMHQLSDERPLYHVENEKSHGAA
jgi:hypothetical protein